ncbi:hypothetical protein CR513_39026, partial [Mucuna pruriens]
MFKKFTTLLEKNTWNLESPNIDYNETLNPIIKSHTIKLILCVAFSKSWPLSQMDVNISFLHDTVDKDMHVSTTWFRPSLTRVQASQSISGISLFIYNHDTTLTYFIVYVDDLLLTINDLNFLNSFKSSLTFNFFFLKDLGSPSHFLSIELVPMLMVYPHIISLFS